MNQVKSQNDETSPAYLQLRSTLRNARNANRRPDTYMERVFTIRQAAGWYEDAAGRCRR